MRDVWRAFACNARAAQRAGCMLLALGVGLVAETASAQTDKELTRARAAFQQAIELEQAGNCTAAVQLFREVGQVRMTPQVRFHIALCEDKLGKLVAALGGYELALADADSVGADFRSEVEENVTRLRQRIPKLVIQRGSGAAAAVVALDGVSLGDTSIGVEVPLDPGPHALSAQAPGFKPFEQTVVISEGERKTVELVLEVQPSSPELTGAASRAGSAGDERPQRLVPYIVGGVGAASLLTSAVLLAFRQNSARTLEKACDDTVCPSSERDEYDRLKAYHYGSFITLGVGVGALGAAATIWVLQDANARQHPTGLRVLPLLGTRFAGVSLRQRF